MTIEKAWWLAGEQVDNSAPFIARDALRQYLIEYRQLSPKSAHVYIPPSAKGKLVSVLLDTKILEVTNDTRKIVEPALASGFLLRNDGERKTAV